VVAVAEQDALRALSDEELFRWASEQSRRIVTENVKDFVPLLRRAEESGHIATTGLFTRSHSFPRSRCNPGPLINALDAWLQAPDVTERPAQDWLTDPK
jgi:hypothetical protein